MIEHEEHFITLPNDSSLTPESVAMLVATLLTQTNYEIFAVMAQHFEKYPKFLAKHRERLADSEMDALQAAEANRIVKITESIVKHLDDCACLLRTINW